MEVPRLGAESELQLPAYTRATAMPDLSRICDPYHSSKKKKKGKKKKSRGDLYWYGWILGKAFILA